MKLVILIFAILCCWLRCAMGNVITFDPSTTSNVVYRLKWGTNYVNLGLNRFITLTGAVVNTFTAVAVNTDGVESEPSNALTIAGTPRSFSINEPPQPPLRLTWTSAINLEGSFDGVNWKHLGTFTTNALELAKQRYQLIRARVGPPPLP